MPYLTAKDPTQPDVLHQWLGADDVNCRSAGWASDFSYLGDGYGLTVKVEGMDWKELCRNHGFHGAIEKVKSAARVRLNRQGRHVTVD